MADPTSYVLRDPTGKPFKLTVPAGTPKDEVMRRAAAMVTPGAPGLQATPGGLGADIRGAMGAGARPLTPGGAPVSPGKLLGETLTDPEALGGTAGELAGMAVPIPGAAVAGAALGGAAGRGVKALSEGRTPGAGELLRAGGEQGAGSLVGNVLSTAGTTAARALTGTGTLRETAEATAARQFLEPRLKKTGIDLAFTPAEASDSLVLDLLQNVAEGGLLSRSRMNTYFANRKVALKQVADDFLDEIAPKASPEQLAAMFERGVNGRSQVSQLLSTALRREFNDRAGHVIVQTGRLRALAAEVIRASERRGHVGAVTEGVPVAEQILELPATMNVADLAQMRSSLLEAKRSLVAGERVPKGKKKVIDRLVSQLDDIINDGIPDRPTRQLWRESNRLVTQRNQTVDAPFLKKLVRISDPTQLAIRGGGAGGDALVDRVFANTNTINATRAALGADSTEFRQLQRRYIERKLMTPEGGVSGNQLADALFGKSQLDDERMAAAFPDAGLRSNLARFANALQQYERKQAGEGVGKVAFQLAQGGAVIGAMTGTLGPSSIATTFIAPRILAEMLTRKQSARLLLQTLETDPSARVAASLVSRIAFTAKKIEEEQAMDDFVNRVPLATQGSVQTQERNIPIPGRAGGGPIEPGQPYMVGEQGPEVVVPNQPATVVPIEARRTRLPADLAGPTGLDFRTPGGATATELVNTFGPERDGKFYNVPMLVPDQVDMQALLAGQPPTAEQRRIAIQWAQKNNVPGYTTLDAALGAEQARHKRLDAFFSRGR